MVKLRTLSNAARGITAKLAAKRNGPYRIIKQISLLSYQIRDEKTSNVSDVRHVSDLKSWGGANNEGNKQAPVVPLHKRGRPRKKTVPSAITTVGSASKALPRSKGGVYSARDSITCSKAAAEELDTYGARVSRSQ